MWCTLTSTMRLRNFLEYRDFPSDPEEDDDENPVFIETDPLYQVAHVVGDDGDPARLQSIVSVRVPMHFWREDEEDNIIFRVMVEASKDNVRRATNWSDLKPPFWAKCGKNLSALAAHPESKGKFTPPPRTPVFYTEEVPKNRLLGIGPRDQAGIYLIRGDARGFVAKRKQGLLGILVFNS